MKKVHEVLGIILFLAVAVVVASRVSGSISCSLSEHDLKRPTDFGWVTGKCITTLNSGERVYTDMLRGVD